LGQQAGRQSLQAKKPLTDRAIRALPAAEKGKRRLLWDALVPGLAVRVTDKGQRSFVLITRYPGSRNPVPRALGAVGAISLEDARTRAREWHKLISAGTDPAQAQADAEKNTLRAICTEYLGRDGAKLRSVEWRRSALERLVFPALGSRPIAEVRRSDLVRLLDKIEDDQGPSMAYHTLAVIRKIFNWYAARSDDFRSPIVRGMARTKRQPRDRVLSDDELRAVWRATGDEFAGPLVFRCYLRFLLLTACRKSEKAKMEWSEITNGDWTLPAARNKTAQDFVRPLSGAAQAVFDALPNRGTWVFTRSGTAPLGGFSLLKADFDRACAVTGWTLHDLRRTARSLMSKAGVPSDHAERCLGHVIGGVRGTYDRHEYHEEKRLAFEALASLIERIVNSVQADVVQLHGGRR
jgi:integrase